MFRVLGIMTDKALLCGHAMPLITVMTAQACIQSRLDWTPAFAGVAWGCAGVMVE